MFRDDFKKKKKKRIKYKLKTKDIKSVNVKEIRNRIKKRWQVQTYLNVIELFEYILF